MIIQVTLQNIHITLSPLRHEMRGYEDGKAADAGSCRFYIRAFHAAMGIKLYEYFVKLLE